MSKTHPSAVIEGLYLSSGPEDFYTSPVTRLSFSLDPNGIVGDSRHSGNTTFADIRTPSYHKKKDVVLNRQSVSLVAAEDLDDIAMELGIDAGALSANTAEDPKQVLRRFLAQCLGANVLLGEFSPGEDISRFRDLGPGTDFGPYDPNSGKFTDATIMITRVNHPCISPGKKIQNTYPLDVPDMAKRFVNEAQGRRGFVGMVAKGGEMAVGQLVSFVPLGMK